MLIMRFLVMVQRNGVCALVSACHLIIILLKSIIRFSLLAFVCVGEAL